MECSGVGFSNSMCDRIVLNVEEEKEAMELYNKVRVFKCTVISHERNGYSVVHNQPSNVLLIDSYPRKLYFIMGHVTPSLRRKIELLEPTRVEGGGKIQIFDASYQLFGTYLNTPNTMYIVMDTVSEAWTEAINSLLDRDEAAKLMTV
jgi:hypothetical protein